MFKYLAVFFVPGLYFLFMWNVPWESFSLPKFLGPLSPSILLDIFIILGFYVYLKKNPITVPQGLKSFGILSVLSVLVATFCILISNGLGLLSPFQYLQWPFIQLLIIAPLIEEGVFRGVFLDLGERAQLNRKVAVLFNSFIFSFSHLPAIWYLDPDFHGFIGFQLFYTLILGFICSVLRFSTKGLVAPIVAHFLFNLVFYVSVQNGYI